MESQLILGAVAKYISLDEADAAFFISLLKEQKLKRRHFLLEEGEICRHSAFVNTGCLKSFSIDKNGFEHVLAFAPSGWWMADLNSLITQRPGQLTIEAIEESTVLLLERNDQYLLFEKIPAFERFFRILVENSLVAIQQRLLDKLSLTAEEHYRSFCKRYPALIERIPQKDVAAYIGITPEFLSKMKSGMAKGK